MTMNPQVGDMWEYSNPEYEPMTFLLCKFRNEHKGSKSFDCISLDDPRVNVVVFWVSERDMWRMLA